MRMTGTQFTRSVWRQVILASSAALCLVLILTVTAFANTVTIADQAGVLNQSKVRRAASELGYPVSIYTVNGFSGSTQQFDRHAANLVANQRNLIVIAIDTSRRYLVVHSGPDVPLTTNETISARQAFASSFNGGDYTTATVSSLNSLRNSPASRGGPSNNVGNNSGSWLRTGACLVGLLLMGGLLFFVLRRRRRPAPATGGGLGGLFNRLLRPKTPEYNPPYQSNVPPYRNDIPPYQGTPPPYRSDMPPYQGTPPPYRSDMPPYQGYYPPNYGSNYGPDNPPQPKGMNPLAAGGLGAAAGGLLGYELGRSQASRESQDEGNREAGGGPGGEFGGGDVGSGSDGYFSGGDVDNGSGGGFGEGDIDRGSGGYFGGDNAESGSGGEFGEGDVGSGSGGYFGGGDTDGGSGGYFGGNEDSGSGSGGNF